MMIKVPMNKNQGIVLLYAVLMVSIVLTVSLSLLNITLKQIILSATNRDSKIAYYAADSALQCAKYWAEDATAPADSPFGYFDGNGNFVSQSDLNKQKVTCFGQEENLNVTTSGSLQTSEFEIDVPFGVSGNGYASVIVTRGLDSNNVAVKNVKASGYNTPDLNSPRRVERTLEAE